MTLDTLQLVSAVYVFVWVLLAVVCLQGLLTMDTSW